MYSDCAAAPCTFPFGPRWYKLMNTSACFSTSMSILLQSIWYFIRGIRALKQTLLIKLRKGSEIVCASKIFDFYLDWQWTGLMLDHILSDQISPSRLTWSGVMLTISTFYDFYTLVNIFQDIWSGKITNIYIILIAQLWFKVSKWTRQHVLSRATWSLRTHAAPPIVCKCDFFMIPINFYMYSSKYKTVKVTCYLENWLRYQDFTFLSLGETEFDSYLHDDLSEPVNLANMGGPALNAILRTHFYR